MPNNDGKIYSATYSNVPGTPLPRFLARSTLLILRRSVRIQLRGVCDRPRLTNLTADTIGSNHVMRRRSDDWINATHILKVAGLDKPSRTRVLEREVQKGVHEKVQGGYGKYQGESA
jgi:hypothetical protein